MKFEWNFIYVILNQILVIDGWGISREIALIWMSLDFTDDQPTLAEVMAWCHQETSHYQSQCWPRSLSPCGVTRPQGDNPLWHNDAIWQHRYGSASVQVMACCLMAPSHYLNQCWLFISEVLWHFTVSAEATILHYEFENYTFKIIAISLRCQWVKYKEVGMENNARNLTLYTLDYFKET